MTIDKQTLIESIIESGGVLSVAAKAANCTVQTIYNNRDKHEDVADAITTSQAARSVELVDKAERNLLTAIDEGEAWATKYVLSTKGKSRGYTEKTEIEHTGVQKINVFFGPKPAKAEDE